MPEPDDLLGAELQQKLIGLFRYALNPGGFLFLGTSETVGDFGDSFAVVDRTLKIYQRKGDATEGKAGVYGLLQAGTALEAVSAGAAGLGAGGHAPIVWPAAGPGARKQPLRELTEQALLKQMTLACALVNRQGNLLYIHGRTGQYLEPALGESGVNNVLKMAREGLRQDLTLALREAASTGGVSRRANVRVKTNGHFTVVNVTVSPVVHSQDSQVLPEMLYLVVWEEAEVQPPSEARHEDSAPAGDDSRLQELQREAQARDEYLQAANEELETANEELKSSSEEIQSANEELQSTNEELETSKEELQSLNEELATVNGELQAKVTDLSRVNNDMNNLLAGTGIGTVFVDLKLRILRFTPSATAIVNLISSDVARPLGHLMSNLVGYDRLVVDAQKVLDTLIPESVEVQTQTGQWYSLRILPYRTLDNVIEGVVICFVDIGEMVRTREQLAGANHLARMAVVVRDSRDAVTVQSLDGRTLAWNPAAERIFGWSEAEALAMNVRERIPVSQRKDALARLDQLSHAAVLLPYQTARLTKDGRELEVSIVATALVDEEGRVYAVATTERVSKSEEPIQVHHG